jgi:hypothetical protein
MVIEIPGGYKQLILRAPFYWQIASKMDLGMRRYSDLIRGCHKREAIAEKNVDEPTIG